MDEQTDLRDRIGALVRLPRPQLVVDSAERDQTSKVRTFCRLFPLVAAGGHYLVGELQTARHPRWDDHQSESIVDLLTDLAAIRALAAQADRSSWSPARLELAAAVERVLFDGRNALVEKRLRHFVKLREALADDILTARYGDRWGTSSLVVPARRVKSRAEVVNHGDGPIDVGRTSFAVPDLRLRHYRDAFCAGLQVVTLGDFMLPDTFRHPGARVLGNRHTHYTTAEAGRLKEHYVPERPRRLRGSYYFLDTEHPGHFGHVTTEVLGRCWGWEHARRDVPTIRPLVSARRRGDLPAFQQAIFAALGIRPERVEFVVPEDPVIVEDLVGATPQFENPHYVDDGIREVWDRLAHGLAVRTAAQGRGPSRVFVSRRPTLKRWCYQTREVEAFFAARGFHVLYPEDLPYDEQARLFMDARVLAGFGGSGMFSMLLNPRATVILVSGNGYNAENEHLMAAANGNVLHYFWGRSDLQVEEGHTQLEAARSNFTFDVQAFGGELEAVIDG